MHRALSAQSRSTVVPTLMLRQHWVYSLPLAVRRPTIGMFRLRGAWPFTGEIHQSAPIIALSV